MKVMTLIVAVGLGVLLQGCSAVVLPTLAALNATSPLEADPAGFEVAATVPEGVDVPAGGATFNLKMARSDTGEAFDEVFVLQRRAATDGRVLFRINPDDLDEMRSLQATAMAWEADDPVASSGSFAVDVVICSLGDGPADDATFSVAIRTEVDGPFLPLIRNAKVSDVLDEIADLGDVEASPRCR